MNSDMNTKNYIHEIGVVRAIACLCIVMLHSVIYVLGSDFDSRGIEKVIIEFANLISFGTAAFVFISELLLAYSYPDKLPKGFYKKRAKYILIPFICMAFIYATFQNYNNITSIPSKFLLNLVGGYHGWFILVIFQFFILHHIIIKYLSNVSTFKVLSISLGLNIFYLSFFNFTEPYVENSIFIFIWDRGYWVSCFGWIFYFTLAYYCGKNYNLFLEKLNSYRIIISFLFVLMLLSVIFYNKFEILPFGSKRVDMLLFSIFAIFILFLISKRINKRIYLLKLISIYSFGIYLLHMFYLMVINFVFVRKGLIDLFGVWTISVYFIFAITLSIVTIYFLNKIPFGKFIIGKV